MGRTESGTRAARVAVDSSPTRISLVLGAGYWLLATGYWLVVGWLSGRRQVEARGEACVSWVCGIGDPSLLPKEPKVYGKRLENRGEKRSDQMEIREKKSVSKPIAFLYVLFVISRSPIKFIPL